MAGGGGLGGWRRIAENWEKQQETAGDGGGRQDGGGRHGTPRDSWGQQETVGDSKGIVLHLDVLGKFQKGPDETAKYP